MKESVGTILKKWRNHQRYSQLQLAVELGVSSKHMSFIETGRSTPSKDMIVTIFAFLQLPKSEINRALNAAGYAPMFTELPLSDEALKPILESVETMIQNHMPYPAIVLNQSWDVIKANDSALTLLADLGYSEHSNLLEALIADNAKTTKIINWDEVIFELLMRLKQEINILGSPPRLQEYVNQLSHCVKVTELTKNQTEQIVLPTKIKLDDKELAFFSIVSQLSNIQDITVSEYRVELMFPADEITKDYYV